MLSAICFRAMKGWLAGCVAATAVIFAFVWIILASVSIGDPVGLVKVTAWLLLPALAVFFVTCVLTGFPASAGACIGVLSETVFAASWGRWPTFTSFTFLFVIAGFVAGMVYWRVAGKYAWAET